MSAIRSSFTEGKDKFEKQYGNLIEFDCFLPVDTTFGKKIVKTFINFILPIDFLKTRATIFIFLEHSKYLNILIL